MALARQQLEELKHASGPDGASSRAARLAAVLQQRIIDGAYQPGERIRESDLQSEFGCSNGPVREALLAMVGAGLAERAPWQGVRVINLDAQEILELFQLRAALIQYVVELAARHGPDEILAEAEALKESVREAFRSSRETGQKLSFTGRFSAWLLAAAGNETISRLWDNTLLRAQIYVNALMRHRAGPEVASIIYALIDAVSARDAPKAVEEARRLARQTLVNLGIEGPI